MNALSDQEEVPLSEHIDGIVANLRKRGRPHLVDITDYEHPALNNTILSVEVRQGDLVVTGKTNFLNAPRFSLIAPYAQQMQRREGLRLLLVIMQPQARSLLWLLLNSETWMQL